jgi:hypothetical protein
VKINFMADLEAGVIVPLNMISDVEGEIILSPEPVFTVSQSGSNVEFNLKITIANSEIIAAGDRDEEYLKQNNLAHLRFGSSGSNTIKIDINTKSIILKQGSSRRVNFDFEFVVNDGKVGGAG